MQPFLSVLARNACVVTICLLVACKPGANDNDALVERLRAATSDLYLARHGLDYPYTPATLEQCQKNQQSSCYKVYQSVENAKQTIRSIPAEKALPALLQLIEVSCDSDDEIEANFVCHGAIMALYFYNSPDEDRKILTAISSFSINTRSILFNNDFAWFKNRPNSQKWVSYINTVEVDWAYDGTRQDVLEAFQEKESGLPMWVSRGL